MSAPPAARAPAPAALRTVVHLRSSGGLFGADRVVLDLCRGLGARGYRAVLAPLVEADGSGQELAERAGAAGIEVAPLVLGGSLDPRLPLRARALARASGAVILHSHDYKSDLAAALARGGWARVATLHGWVGTSAALRFKEGLDARLVRRFDRVICVSAALAAREQHRGLRAPVVVHNGIDLQPFAATADAGRQALRAELGLDPQLPVIGAIGRLSAEKGFDVLLAAAARLRQRGQALQVLLVGEGPAAAALEAQAAALGLGERLRLPGVRSDAARLYPVFDVFCMPSRREGLPLALLEALAARCAVVATPVGGIPEVLESGAAAAVSVAPEDPTALANAVGALLADPERRRRLGQSGRARVEQAFSAQRMTARVAEVYDALLAARRTAAGRGAAAAAPGDPAP